MARCLAYLHTLAPALPAFTALIGFGSFIIGIHSFIAPVSAAQIYGVQLPSPPSSSLDDAPSTAENNAHAVAYICAHGIRTLVAGLSVMSLTACWRWQASLEARATAQRCLAIVLLAGTLTPIVDALIVWQSAQKTVDGVPGKKAARAHALVSRIWLAGGLWCFFG